MLNLCCANSGSFFSPVLPLCYSGFAGKLILSFHNKSCIWVVLTPGSFHSYYLALPLSSASKLNLQFENKSSIWVMKTPDLFIYFYFLYQWATAAMPVNQTYHFKTNLLFEFCKPRIHFVSLALPLSSAGKSNLCF